MPIKKKRTSVQDSRDLSIGLVLKSARQAKGFSQAEVAKKLGYDSAQFISDWERGYAAIPMKCLAEIGSFLDIDRDYLFELLLEFSVARLRTSMREEFAEQLKMKRLKK